jgi:hypothetical protein
MRATKKETKTKKPNVTAFDPNLSLYWSRRRLVITIMVCVALSLFAVFTFLVIAQYRKIEDATETSGPEKIAAPEFKHYANQYWGVEFDYPGKWTQPIGSYQDGEYYFSSEPINFINELEAGEAIIALKTYNNWKGLSFGDWFGENRYLFLPSGELSAPRAETVAGVPAHRYTLRLSKPQNNTAVWDILLVSRNQATKYFFALEADNDENLKKYQPVFDTLLTSLTFTKVGNNPNGQ